MPKRRPECGVEFGDYFSLIKSVKFKGRLFTLCRPDCAGRAVRDDALPRPKAAVLEQSLPCGQARDWQARAHREVDVARQRREVARLHGYILRQSAVAIPV